MTKDNEKMKKLLHRAIEEINIKRDQRVLTDLEIKLMGVFCALLASRVFTSADIFSQFT